MPWLGWTCGECRYCRGGPREPLRARPLHRLRPRRRLRRGRGRRRALLLPDPRRLPGRAGGAAALRRADRLPGAAPVPARRASGSASTASAPRPTSSARSRCTRAGGSSPSPARATPRARRFARELGAEWAGAATGPAPEPLDAAIVFAPVGELVPAALRASRQGRDRRLRRHPHERHPGLPLRDPLGGAGASLGRQPDPPRRRGVHAARAEVPVRTQRQRLSARSCRATPSTTCASGRVRGAAV